MSNNSLNTVFNLDEFERIEDIIFLDQPILTHLVKGDRDYFKYLIDVEKQYDLFLLIEIEKEALVDYILNKITLHSIITKTKHFCILFKEDFKGTILEGNIISPQALDTDYLPSDDSYLGIDFTDNSYYRTLINKYNESLYLRELKNDAFYLKFEPTDPKFHNTIGFMDLSSKLLENVAASYKNFVQADFNGRFREEIGDQGKLNKKFNAVSAHIDPRVVYAAYGSFEIGIAVDTVMKLNIEDKSLREWATEVGHKYKTLILDSNIDDKDADNIISKYNENDRKKIFEPLISIINNPNFNLKVKESKNSNYKKYTIEKEIRIKIVPASPKEITIDKDLGLVNFTAVIDKNAKTKKMKISPEKSLFTTMDYAMVYITNKEFENQGFTLDETINIPVQIESQRNYIKLSAEYQGQEFTNEEYSEDLNQALLSLVKKIALFLKL